MQFVGHEAFNASILSGFTDDPIASAPLIDIVSRIASQIVSTVSCYMTLSSDLADAYSFLSDFIFLVLTFSITFNHRGLYKRVHFSRSDTN